MTDIPERKFKPIFERAAVADILGPKTPAENDRDFLVKVIREQDPELDALYMNIHKSLALSWDKNKRCIR